MVDTHAHLFLEDFADDLPEVIQRARDAGVTRILMPNIDSSTVPALLAVCDDYPDYCFPMTGLHPTSVGEDYEAQLDDVKRRLESSVPFVAIGETGMDLYWDTTYKAQQEAALRQQIEWALHYRLPIVLHCREAFEPLYKVLQDYRDTPLRGVFHSFTGTADEARRIMQLPGFYIGINGVVTFKKSTLPEALAVVPLERVLLETDAPYLTPVPFRGKRNESAFIKYTLETVARCYKLPMAEVDNITTGNAMSLFGITPKEGKGFKVY
ncbi:MAG: TatD family hydrolase [Prevotellaceae bacterium]|jgi:TatD DNase family protein|nr:TatD family hydrolase [Prevotellaceae bacterium]